MWFIDYLLEPIGLTLLLSYYFPGLCFIVRLFTQDSISSGFRYLLHRLEVPIQMKDISSFPKYTFYLMVILSYYLIYLLTWNNFPMTYVYYSLLLVTSPSILDKIFQTQYWLVEALEQRQRKMLNYVSSVFLANSINHICIQNLQSDPKLSARELNEVLTPQSLDYVKTFLKIMLVTTLVKYFKKNSFYLGNLVKFLYDTGNIIEIPRNHRSLILNSHVHRPRETLAKIIQTRKWHYLYDPTVLNMIIKIYKEQDGNLLQDIISEINTRILQFFSVWSLSSINIFPIPVLAFIFRIRDPYPQNLVIPFIDTLLVFLYPEKRMWISLFSSFGGYLNKGLYCLFNQLWEVLPQIGYILTHKKKYNYYLLVSIPTVYYISRLPYGVCFLPFVCRFNFIYWWLVPLGAFSGYQMLHLSSLIILLYLVINLADYEYAPRPDINFKLIDSYYRQTINNLAMTIGGPQSPCFDE